MESGFYSGPGQEALQTPEEEADRINIHGEQLNFRKGVMVKGSDPFSFSVQHRSLLALLINMWICGNTLLVFPLLVLICFIGNQDF